MIDDFNFTLDNSDFSVSIEKFAAYLDGNLSESEMDKVGSMIENDEAMQDVMAHLEQSELTFTEYEQENIQLPEELLDTNFEIPIINDEIDVGDSVDSFGHVACAAAPVMFDSFNDFIDNEKYKIDSCKDDEFSDEPDSSYINFENDFFNENQTRSYLNDIDPQILNDENLFADNTADDILTDL